MERLNDKVLRVAAGRGERAPQPEARGRMVDQEAIERARRDTAVRRVPGKFRIARLDDVEDAVRPALEAWVGDPTRNLVLAGPVGTGKSHAMAAALMAAYQRHGQAAAFRWTTTLALMERSKPGAEDDGGPTLTELRRIALAGLDDLGAERNTEWTAERLALLVDERYHEPRPTVATTNLTLGPDGELIAALGPRTYSRLVGDGATVLTLTNAGIDRRLGR